MPDQSGRPTVRDATFALLRKRGVATIFGNPGSTEVPLLTDLPDWLGYTLALHEGAAVGIATGYALGRGEPALVNLHTIGGLGNAINAIANARDCRAPLVVVVGQQDRRQLAFEPFLHGRGLERLAGDYAVWASFPARAQDVPGSIDRAFHEATAGGGPALVVVPMGDWEEQADDLAAATPAAILRSRAVADPELAPLAALLEAADAPAIVVGAGTASPEGWDGVVALAERLGCPVWQEAFSSRAGFPPTHPRFAGDLPWRRRQIHDAFADHDLVLAVGTSAFRTYLFDEALPLTPPQTEVAVLTEDAAEAHRSRCRLALVAPVAPACAALARLLRRPAREQRATRSAPQAVQPGGGQSLKPADVFHELALRLPEDVVLVEETPSSRAELLAQLPARTPFGFFANGGGALGYGLAGAIGLRLALPERPVVAVLGDGSAMYTIQALWSAARYQAGMLAVVLANGRYEVMDRLAADQGGAGAWPGFEIDVAGLARCLGCPSLTVACHAELTRALDETIPDLRDRREPLVLEVDVREPRTAED